MLYLFKCINGLTALTTMVCRVTVLLTALMTMVCSVTVLLDFPNYQALVFPESWAAVCLLCAGTSFTLPVTEFQYSLRSCWHNFADCYNQSRLLLKPSNVTSPCSFFPEAVVFYFYCASIVDPVKFDTQKTAANISTKSEAIYKTARKQI